MGRAGPVLAGITRRIQDQQGLASWTLERLPPDLVPHVTGVLEKDGELALLAESAAWAGRLRYAAQALLPQLAASHPQIRAVRVRVVPAAGAVSGRN